MEHSSDQEFGGTRNQLLARLGRHMIVAGVDVGSCSVKAVIMKDGQVARWRIIPVGSDPIESLVNVMNLALEESALSMRDIEYVVSTGYGRLNVPFAQLNVTEISCHAKGTQWLFPEVRTILDMGGQDCKAIRCDQNGRAVNFAMNDKCAAGTGRYLERVAAIFGFGVEEIGPLSLRPIGEVLTITSRCVIFAESDITGLIRQGKHRDDILASATEAVVDRVCALLNRVGVGEALSISGGIAKNVGVVTRLERRFGLKARIADEPQIMGALGAALFAADRLKRKAVTGPSGV